MYKISVISVMYSVPIITMICDKGRILKPSSEQSSSSPELAEVLPDSPPNKRVSLGKSISLNAAKY